MSKMVCVWRGEMPWRAVLARVGRVGLGFAPSGSWSDRYVFFFLIDRDGTPVSSPAHFSRQVLGREETTSSYVSGSVTYCCTGV